MLRATGTSALAVAHRLQRLARQSLPVLQLGARRFSGRRSPFQMTLSLTNRCNFRCEYCDIPLQHRAEMTTSEGAVPSTSCARRMGRASLIGGEPLLFRGFGQVVRRLTDLGVHTAMNSNGWLVKDCFEDVRRLDLVCLTLDGPADVHDMQRRRGSHERVIAAIEALRGFGTPVVTMTVLTPKGADSVDHVLDVARTYGLKAFFQLEHDKGCDVMAPIAPRLADDRIRDLAARLLARKEEGAPVGNSRPLLERQQDHRYLGSCADCHAGRYYGYVLSDGTVAPCLLTQWQQAAGNGRRDGFLRAFEQLAPPRGPGCACVPTHEVNRVLDLDARALWHAVEVTLGLPRV